MKGFDDLDYDLNFLVDSSEEKKNKKKSNKKIYFNKFYIFCFCNNINNYLLSPKQ